MDIMEPLLDAMPSSTPFGFLELFLGTIDRFAEAVGAMKGNRDYAKEMLEESGRVRHTVTLLQTRLQNLPREVVERVEANISLLNNVIGEALETVEEYNSIRCSLFCIPDIQLPSFLHCLRQCFPAKFWADDFKNMSDKFQRASTSLTLLLNVLSLPADTEHNITGMVKLLDDQVGSMEESNIDNILQAATGSYDALAKQYETELRNMKHAIDEVKAKKDQALKEEQDKRMSKENICADLENRVKSLNKELEEEREKAKKLKNTCDVVQEQLNASKEKCSEQEATLQRNLLEMTMQDEIYQNNEWSQAQLKAEMDAAQNAQGLDRVEALSQDMKVKEGEIVRLQAKNATLKMEKTNMEREFDRLQKEHTRLEHFHGTLSETVANLEEFQLHDKGYLGRRLFRAVQAKNLEDTKKFLALGADPNYVDSPQIFTPLIVAIGYGDETLISALLLGGADPSLPDKRGKPPIWCACLGGQTSIVRILTDAGADLEWRDEYMWTVIFCAARYGHSDILQFLINRGADTEVRGQVSGEMLTLLEVATLNHHTRAAEVLRELLGN